MSDITPYTKRELDSKFENLDSSLDGHFKTIKETLSRIENHAIKTNGRVTLLEKWKEKVIGGVVIISMVVLQLVIYSFNLALSITK